jgi:glycerophosphoryl diester phosphodiesterase
MKPTSGAVEIVAHRGASADAPEHTLLAYDLALTQGADVLELDLRSTADGELVVLHDATLARTAGDPRRVADLGAADLARLPSAARPLGLDEILARYQGRTRFLLELKDPTPAMEGRLVQAVAEAGAGGDVVVQSFEVEALRRIRSLDPRLPVAPLFYRTPFAPWRERWLDGLAALGAVAVGVHRRQVDAGLVAAAHRRGLVVRSWTVNDAAEAARHVALGVDGLITDRPGAVRAAVRVAVPALAAA